MLLAMLAAEHLLATALLTAAAVAVFRIDLALAVFGAGAAATYLLWRDLRHRGVWVLLDNLRVPRGAFLAGLFGLSQLANLLLALGTRR